MYRSAIVPGKQTCPIRQTPISEERIYQMKNKQEEYRKLRKR